MGNEPWKQLATLLDRMLRDGEILTLDAAQHAFNSAPDAPLSASDITAIVESASYRWLRIGHRTDMIPWHDLLFTDEMCASHPAELVRSHMICEVHSVGTEFDSSSIDVRRIELPRVSYQPSKRAASPGAFICDVVSAGSDLESSTCSAVYQGTTRWQTGADERGLSERRLDGMFEPCCQWARSEEEEWTSFWKN